MIERLSGSILSRLQKKEADHSGHCRIATGGANPPGVEPGKGVGGSPRRYIDVAQWRKSVTQLLVARWGERSAVVKVRCNEPLTPDDLRSLEELRHRLDEDGREQWLQRWWERRARASSPPPGRLGPRGRPVRLRAAPG